MLAPRSGSWVATPLVLLGAWLGIALTFLHLPFGVVLLTPVGGLAGLAILFVVFFRDPERLTADGVVSPADGRITTIVQREGKWEVSIFMNLHNVHVNRMPLDGTVERITHHPGGHRPAFSKDSLRNERMVYEVTTSFGTMVITQIAGAFARRCVSYVKPGTHLAAGARFGMIRLSSRVDLQLPAGAALEPAVTVGERVHAGTTTLLRFATGEG